MQYFTRDPVCMMIYLLSCVNITLYVFFCDTRRPSTRLVHPALNHEPIRDMLIPTALHNRPHLQSEVDVSVGINGSHIAEDALTNAHVRRR